MRAGNGNGDHPIEGAEKAWLRNVLRKPDIGIERDEEARLQNVLEQEEIADEDKARLREIGEAARQREREINANRRFADEEIPPSWLGRIYFDKSTQTYCIPEGKLFREDGTLTPLDKVSSWLRVNETSAIRFLVSLGTNPQKATEELQSEVKQTLLIAQTEHAIDFCGPRGGYMAGKVLNHNGEKFFVTSSPKLIEPKEGDFPTIKKLLGGLFGEEEIYFLAWMKDTVEGLRSGARNTGKALVMVGPRNCGKSFVQKHIITPLNGGRVADPYLFMSGGSVFNDSLAGCEHWAIEDQGHTDSESRKDLAVAIKQAVANDGIAYHPKGKALKVVQAFRRLSISLNDEAKYLAVLPSMDPSLEDKLLLLHAHKGGIPEDHGDLEIQKAYAAKIKGELPAFLHYLLNLEIDPKYKGRFGVADYKNPEILRMMEAMEPEFQALEYIEELWNEEINKKRFGRVEGTTSWILSCLLESGVGRQVQALCRGSTRAFGRYLASLAKKRPDKITSRILDGKTLYTIYWGKDLVNG